MVSSSHLPITCSGKYEYMVDLYVTMGSFGSLGRKTDKFRVGHGQTAFAFYCDDGIVRCLKFREEDGQV